VPVVGDYDGDGHDDIGVYDDRTGMWFIYGSQDGFRHIRFGYPGTLPIGSMQVVP